jgi:hypothetical protein
VQFMLWLHSPTTLEQFYRTCSNIHLNYTSAFNQLGSRVIMKSTLAVFASFVYNTDTGVNTGTVLLRACTDPFAHPHGVRRMRRHEPDRGSALLPHTRPVALHVRLPQHHG